MRAETRDRLLRYGPLAACAAVLVWHSLQYAFITDDAYITFVYARNLAEHGELAFNVGLEPVEGFTNFLWAVVLAGFMAIGVAPELSSLVLSTGFAIGTLAVAFALVSHLRAGRGTAAWDALPASLLALSAGFACWTSGGLETQMFTFWIALGLYAYVRGDADGRWLRRVGPIFALAAMTRPEGVLVAGVVGAHRLAFAIARDRRLRPTRDELWCLAGFFALWAPYFAWRWWYFGYPFPNTYYVKAAGDPPDAYREQLLANGLYYVRQWATQSGALYAAPLALIGALAARPRTPRFFYGTLAVAVAVVYLAYTARVGGDFMGLHRFVMPVFFLAATTTALGLHTLARRIPGRDSRVPITAAAALLLLTSHAYTQNQLTRESMRWGNWANDRGIDTPAFLWVYTHDRAVIGKHMRACMRDTDFSILGGAGAKPYYGHMRGIDVFGLVSEEIAHQVPPTRPRAGHNKWAPDRFLLDHYDPDFIFHCYSIHADPDRPHFNCNPTFWRTHGYDPVTLEIEGLRQVLGPNPTTAAHKIETNQDHGYYTFWKKRSHPFPCPGDGVEDVQNVQ